MAKMANNRLPNLSRVGQTKNKQVLSFYHDCMLRVFDNHASRQSHYLEKVIFSAARTGDSQKLYNALQKVDLNKVDLNLKENETGNTPLMVAAGYGHEKVVSILLSCGCDVTLRNVVGRTAIDIAPERIKELILGAVNRRGAGQLLLWQAAWQGNATVVKKLLNLNPNLNINSTNSEGFTPLLLVTRDLSLFDKIEQKVFSENYNPTEVVAQLLHQNADCTVVDYEGRSALHLAARNPGSNAKNIINLLARKDSQDVDLRDNEDRSALHFACETGDTIIMLALIDSGADINARGQLGRTPLHVTASRGDEGTSGLLVGHGANVLLVDDFGFTPVDVAKGDNVQILLREAWAEHVDRAVNFPRIKSAPNTLLTVKLEHLEVQDAMNEDEEQKLPKKTTKKSLKKLQGRSHSEEQSPTPPSSNLPRRARSHSSGPTATSRHSVDPVIDVNQSGERSRASPKFGPGYTMDDPPLDSGIRQTKTLSRLVSSEVVPRTAAKVTVLNIDCKLPKQKSKSCSELHFPRYRIPKRSSQRTSSESLEQPLNDILSLRGRPLSVKLSSFDTLPQITPELPDETKEWINNSGQAPSPKTQIVITPSADDPLAQTKDDASEHDGDGILNRTFNSKDRPVFWFPLAKDNIETDNTDQSCNQSFFVNLNNIETPVEQCAKCRGSLKSGGTKPHHGTVCFSCHQESVGKNCFWVSLDGKGSEDDKKMAAPSAGFDDRTVLVDKKMLKEFQRRDDSVDIEIHGVKSLSTEGEIHRRKEKFIKSNSDATKVDGDCGQKVCATVDRSHAESVTLNADNDVRYGDLGFHSGVNLKENNFDLKENKAREIVDPWRTTYKSYDRKGGKGCEEQRELREHEEQEGIEKEGFEGLDERLEYEEEKELKRSGELKGSGEPKGMDECVELKEQHGCTGTKEQPGYEEPKVQREFEEGKGSEEPKESQEYEESKEQQGYTGMEEQHGNVEPEEQEEYQKLGDGIRTSMDEDDRVKVSRCGTESYQSTYVGRDSEIIPHEVVIVNPFPSPVPPKVPVVNVVSNCHCDRFPVFTKEIVTRGKQKGVKGKTKKSGASSQSVVVTGRRGSVRGEGDTKYEKTALKKKSAVIKRKKKGKEKEDESVKEISVIQPNLKDASPGTEPEVNSVGNHNTTVSVRRSGTEEFDAMLLPVHRATSLKETFAVLSPIPESPLPPAAVVESEKTGDASKKTEEPTKCENLVPRLSEIVLTRLMKDDTTTEEASATAATQGGVGEVGISPSDDLVSEMDEELEDMIQEILEETEELETNHAKRHENDVDSTKACTDIDRSTELESTELESTELENTKLESTELENTELESTKLENTKLENTELENTELESTELESTELENTKLESTELENTELENTELESTKLDNTELENTELESTELESTELESTELENTELENTELENTKTKSDTHASSSANSGTRETVSTNAAARSVTTERKTHASNNVSSWLLGNRGFAMESDHESSEITGGTDSTYGSRATTSKARMADVSSDYSSLSDDSWDEYPGRGDVIVARRPESNEETSASTSAARLSSERWSTSSVSVVGDYPADGRASVGNGSRSEEIRGRQFAASGGLVHSRLGRCRSEHSVTGNSESSGEEEIVWKKGNVLGKGAFGTVWCGLTNAGKMIAVKQVELITSNMEVAERQYEKLQEEVALLRSLRHENIVSYLGTCLDGGVVNIFMQFVPGGSIASILARFGPLEETVFRFYTRQIVVGVEYLHRNKVVHRDIKGGNIMLMPTGVIKLIDFGCAKRLYMNMSHNKEDLLRSMKGTPYWMAPEVITETGYGRKSDIWSIGCTVFEMATGKPPWSHLPPMSAILRIGQGTEPPTLGEPNSRHACDFVMCSMTRNPNTRWSAEELLRHPFIKNCDELR